MQLDAGAIVDRKYEVLAPMAEGGMGAVYRARHLLTEQIVALKVLNVGPGDEAIARRFKLEVSVAAKIRHPGIVKVFDAGTDAKSERFYLAMELLEGESLRDYMERPGRDPQRAVRWLADALEVMVAAHAQGVVHRDLKPENLFLEDQANGTEVKVLDFGIARDLAGPSVTTTGVAVGTALYMAPEQATASKAVGPAADVWAMGVMLYEVLGGERPFDGPSAHAVVVEAVTMPHRPLTELRADLSPGWGELVDACLAKKPEGRPSAAAVSRDLRALLEKGEALEAPFPLATPRSVPEDADTAPASALDGSGIDGGESARVRVGAVDSVPQPSVPPPPQRAPSPAWLAAGLVAFGLLGLGGWLALGGDAEPADRVDDGAVDGTALDGTGVDGTEPEPPEAEARLAPPPAEASDRPAPARDVQAPTEGESTAVTRPRHTPRRAAPEAAPAPTEPEPRPLAGAAREVVERAVPAPAPEREEEDTPAEPESATQPRRPSSVLLGSDAFGR